MKTVVLKLVCLVLSIVSVIWLYTTPGYEALIASLTGIIGLVGISIAEPSEWTKQKERQRYANLDHHVSAIHDHLSDSLIREKFLSAKDSIRIQQIWMTNIMSVKSSILSAAQRCDVKILLLNPMSAQTQYRSKDLGYHDLDKDGLDYVRKAIISNMIAFKELNDNERVGKNIEIRFYDATPILLIYGYDDTNLLGIYWRNVGAVSTPQLEVSKSMELYDLSMKHFNDLWKKSIPFDEVYSKTYS